MAVTDSIIVRNLGILPYEPVLNAMQFFTKKRTVDTPDEIWLLEHPSIYTLGQAADPIHVLNSQNIPVFQSDRGGEVTYHGPGQAVVYLLLDIKRRMKNRLLVKELVRTIEQVVIDTLADYHLFGERKSGAPGIYLSQNDVERKWQGAKIAALGLKVKSNGCTYHGFSLNVAMDLLPFSGINPCGDANLISVDMQSLGKHYSVSEVQHQLVKNLCRHLNVQASFQQGLPLLTENMMKE